MKVKLLIVFLFVTVFTCAFTVACDIKIDDNGGTIISNLTSLPVPQNLRVEDDYVMWDSVPNASSYVVKVNGKEENCGNSLKYSLSSIMDNKLATNASETLHIIVKAIGNSIYYADSNWSNEIVYVYTKTSTINTKLQTPTNIRIKDNIVTWDEIPNAIGYQIKINEDSKFYSTACTYFDISYLFDKTTHFDISLQSIASKHSIYENSDWTLRSPLQYTRLEEIIGFDNQYFSNGLGRTIDLINGTSYVPKNGAGFIFNQDDLFKKILIVESIGKQDATYEYDTSFESFQLKWTLDTGLKIANNTDKKFNAMPGRTDFSIDFNCGYEQSTKENTKELYIKMKHNITGNQVEILGHATDYNYFASILSENFKDAARKVVDEKTAEEFIYAWGTHVIMSAIYGAGFEASYYNISHDLYTKDDWYIDLEAAVKSRLYLSDLEINTEIENTINKNKSTENTMSKFTSNVVGGSVVALANDLGSFKEAYNNWANNLKEDSYTLIDFPDASLYCIWDYLDDSFSNQKRILNNYLVSHCNANMAFYKDRISGIYNSDNEVYLDNTKRVKYNTETKILTFDFSGIQEIGFTTYNQEDNSTKNNFDYENFNEGILSVNPIYKGKEIKKVVFKSNYKKLSDIDGHIISNKIQNLQILFSNWNSDVDIVFEDFAYTQCPGRVPLNLASIPKDKTVKITFIGNNFIGTVFDKTDYSIICGGNIELIGNESKMCELDGSLKIEGNTTKSVANLEISESKSKSVSRHRSDEYLINDSGRGNQKYDCYSFNEIFGCSKEELQSAGFTTIKIKIDKIEIKEKDDGYQYIFINWHNTKSEDDLVTWELEHFHGSLDKTWWYHEKDGRSNKGNEMVKEFNIDSFKDGKIYVRFGARGDYNDDWYNRNLHITFTLIK